MWQWRHRRIRRIHDPYYLGRVVGHPVAGEVIVHKEQGRGATFDGTYFSRGDVGVAVEWFARDDSDPDRRTFIETPGSDSVSDISDCTVFNSSELRMIMEPRALQR